MHPMAQQRIQSMWKVNRQGTNLCSLRRPQAPLISSLISPCFPPILLAEKWSFCKSCTYFAPIAATTIDIFFCFKLVVRSVSSIVICTRSFMVMFLLYASVISSPALPYIGEVSSPCKVRGFRGLRTQLFVYLLSGCMDFLWNWAFAAGSISTYPAA